MLSCRFWIFLPNFAARRVLVALWLKYTDRQVPFFIQRISNTYYNHIMGKKIQFSLVYRDMWQSSGKFQPRKDQFGTHCSCIC